MSSVNQLAATFSQKATETAADDQRFFFHAGFEEKRTAVQQNVIKLRQHNGCRNLKISIHGKNISIGRRSHKIHAPVNSSFWGLFSPDTTPKPLNLYENQDTLHLEVNAQNGGEGLSS